jgi:CheY-like chemotaxis protein
MLGAVEPDAGWTGGDWTSVIHGRINAAGVDDGADEIRGLTTEESAPGATRVLVVGADRRFRSVAAALLSRRGCAVTLHERMTSVAELAKREGTEVVILDAGTSLTAAAYEAAQIEKLDPPVGVVVVGDVPEESLSAMPVLAKWGSFDALFSAVEQSVHHHANGSTLGAHQ